MARTLGGARGRLRGARARGGILPQASSTDGLNLEELASSAIKVDTLRKLMKGETDSSSEEEGTNEPKKFISLDQVVVRGEDLTGRLDFLYCTCMCNTVFCFFYMHRIDVCSISW